MPRKVEMFPSRHFGTYFLLLLCPFSGGSLNRKSLPAKLPNFPPKSTNSIPATQSNSSRIRTPFRRVEDDPYDLPPELADNSFSAKVCWVICRLKFISSLLSLYFVFFRP